MAGFINSLLSQLCDFGFKRLNISRQCDLLEIREYTTPDKIDLEAEHRILIGCGSGQRIDFAGNTEQLRQKLADMGSHRDKQRRNLRLGAGLFRMISVIVPCSKQLRICGGNFAIEYVEQFFKTFWLIKIGISKTGNPHAEVG